MEENEKRPMGPQLYADRQQEVGAVKLQTNSQCTKPCVKENNALENSCQGTEKLAPTKEPFS